MEKRESWATKTGFVLACAGNAIGLGNLWMFPWRVGTYGGATFLIIYLILVFGVLTTGVMMEFAFGRSQQKGPVGAVENVSKERGTGGWWRAGAKLGFFPLFALFGIGTFYIIVVGWALKYFVLSIKGFAGMNMPAYFSGFVGTPETIGWHFLAVVITAIIVMLGVQKGIERSCKVMMPTLFVLLIIMLVRSVTLPGAMGGIRFLLVPDWSYAKDPVTWIMALGQGFFSLSLGGGMLICASYLKKEVGIPEAAFQTAGLDILASLLAAFVIMPAVFAFGLEPAAGPPLLFITLPSIFPTMPGGHFFGVVFFLCVVFAVISSSINHWEILTEAVMDRLKWGRRKAVMLVSTIVFLVGLPLALSMDRFGAWSNLFSIYLNPIGCVVLAVIFFWVFGAFRGREEVNINSRMPMGKWWEPFGKYGFVGVTTVILILGIIFGGIG